MPGAGSSGRVGGACVALSRSGSGELAAPAPSRCSARTSLRAPFRGDPPRGVLRTAQSGGAPRFGRGHRSHVVPWEASSQQQGCSRSRRDFTNETIFSGERRSSRASGDLLGRAAIFSGERRSSRASGDLPGRATIFSDDRRLSLTRGSTLTQKTGCADGQESPRPWVAARPVLRREAPLAGGRPGKERAARHERSGDWGRGAASSPTRVVIRQHTLPRPGQRQVNTRASSPTRKAIERVIVDADAHCAGVR